MAKSYRFYEFSVLKCNSNESATKGDNAMSKKIRTEIGRASCRERV